jgi:(1->4)-alpha-D-glucan 1-alpha-D-glucosylmutase
MAMLRDGEGLEADQFWGDTRLVLPDAFRDRTWSEVLSGRSVAAREAVLIRDLMDGQTVAILTSDE